MMPPPDGYLDGPMPPPEGYADGRPAKKRRLKGLDTQHLTQLLTGLHQCLDSLLELLPAAKSEKEDEPAKPREVPLQHLEEEFERHWHLRFDAKAVGELNTTDFLKRFPEVFRVRNNGFQIMVSPAEDPNFEDAAEVGMERAETQSEPAPDFTTSCAEQVISLLVNLVAEERKSGGAPLNFQYTSYEVVQDLLSKTREGGTPKEQSDLLNTLLDPKPLVVKEDPPHRNFDRDRQERRRSESPDRNQPALRDRDPSPRGRQPSPRRNDFDDRRGKGGGGGKGGGPSFQADRRGNDGRSLCRQFQSGRCTYGDSCKFAHESENERRY